MSEHDVATKTNALPDESRAKFRKLPDYLSIWTRDYGGIEGKRVLDFGCGSGLSAAGIALLHGASLVHGVDINEEFKACAPFLKNNFEIEQPNFLSFQEIRPGEQIGHSDFDIMFSWSVFEHVNNRLYPQILADLYTRLKPGGLFFVQISPLYLSPEGSHLWALGYTDWQHLTNQISDTYSDIFNSQLSDDEKHALWSMFSTLNRITADDLIERFESAGFKLMKEQRDDVQKEPPSALLRSYRREALLNHQIVALFQKP